MINNQTGTARTNRLTTFMDPVKAPIDNRSLKELLTYAAEVAAMIKFFDKHNKENGTWEAFFTQNETFFLAWLSNTDMESVYMDGSQYILDYHRYQKNNLPKRAEMLLKLIENIKKLSRTAADWHRRAQQVRKTGEETPIESKIKSVITNHLKDDNWFLNSIEKILKTYDIEKIEEDEFTDEERDSMGQLWEIDEDEKSGLDFGLNKEEALDLIYERVKAIFASYYHHLLYITQYATDLLNNSLESNNNHEPLMGLLISFLKIFNFQQEHLNGFAKKHLDYFYHDILEQTPRAAVTDHAFVHFLLNKGTKPHFIHQDTLLLAGVNKDGLESHYKTLQELWVSEAEIKTVKTIFISRNPDINFGSSFNLVSNIYAAPMANSKDGQGATFDELENSWAIVGEDQTNFSTREKTMVPGTIGIILSAPILYLEAGDRTIEIDITTDQDTLDDLFVLLRDMSENENKSVGEIFSNLFYNAIDVFVSSNSGWIQIEDYHLEPPSQWDDGKLKINIHMEKDLPPLVPIEEGAIGGHYPTKWPMLKLVLNSGSSIYAYSFFQPLKIAEIEIVVKVRNLPKMIVNNGGGEFNNSTSFPPFGPVPNKDSLFLIGNRELFLKNIEKLGIDIEWNNLPEEPGGFTNLYQHYKNDKGASLNITNETFQVKISALSHSKYHPSKEAEQQTMSLFQMDGECLSPITNLDSIDVQKLHLIPHLKEPLKLEPYNNDTRLGYIKLALHQPSFAFGHTIYPKNLADVVTGNALLKAKRRWFWQKEPQLMEVPAEPYNPVVKRINIHYEAKSSIRFLRKGVNISEDEKQSTILHLSPFGYRAIYSGGRSIKRELFQRFGSDGYLLIGLDNLKPGLPLNFLFKLKIVDKALLETSIRIKWYYLRSNEFLEIKKEQFLYDSTYNFTSTGVVSMIIPEDINKDNTILPPDHYWLIASARGDVSKTLGRAVQIVPHAVEAEWVDNGDPYHYKGSVKLPRIQDLVVKIGAIASVQQIGDFFGGHPKEVEELLWARVSERLRHKGRAINIWDYERLVLDKFPGIRQVKGIGRTGNEDLIELGEVTVVVVPETISHQQLRPMVGFHILNDIQQYLKSISSPHLKIKIINPSYEWLKISADIMLKPNLKNQSGKYLDHLYRDIENFICPWLEGGTVKIGGGFKKRDLLTFMLNRPYIEYITSFSVVHVFEEERKIEKEGKGVNEGMTIIEKRYEYDLLDSAQPHQTRDEIRATKPWSILVPSDLHTIEFTEDKNYQKPQVAAIDQMVIGTDFIIKDEKFDFEEEETPWLEPSDEQFFIVNLE